LFVQKATISIAVRFFAIIAIDTRDVQKMRIVIKCVDRSESSEKRKKEQI